MVAVMLSPASYTPLSVSELVCRPLAASSLMAVREGLLPDAVGASFTPVTTTCACTAVEETPPALSRALSWKALRVPLALAAGVQ